MQSVTDPITHHHVAALQGAGYEIFEAVINEGAPGHIVVADPVLCMSGGKRWAEVRRETLRTGPAVWRFINERS